MSEHASSRREIGSAGRAIGEERVATPALSRGSETREAGARGSKPRAPAQSLLSQQPTQSSGVFATTCVWGSVIGEFVQMPPASMPAEFPVTRLPVSVICP